MTDAIYDGEYRVAFADGKDCYFFTSDGEYITGCPFCGGEIIEVGED